MRFMHLDWGLHGCCLIFMYAEQVFVCVPCKLTSWKAKRRGFWQNRFSKILAFTCLRKTDNELRGWRTFLVRAPLKTTEMAHLLTSSIKHDTFESNIIKTWPVSYLRLKAPRPVRICVYPDTFLIFSLLIHRCTHLPHSHFAGKFLGSTLTQTADNAELISLYCFFQLPWEWLSVHTKLLSLENAVKS